MKLPARAKKNHTPYPPPPPSPGFSHLSVTMGIIHQSAHHLGSIIGQPCHPVPLLSFSISFFSPPLSFFFSSPKLLRLPESILFFFIFFSIKGSSLVMVVVLCWLFFPPLWYSTVDGAFVKVRGKDIAGDNRTRRVSETYNVLFTFHLTTTMMADGSNRLFFWCIF